MIIWKPLVCECLQYVKKPADEVDKNGVAVVRANSHYKQEVVGHEQQKYPLLHPCFYPCPIVLWTSLRLGNWLTMEVNTDWKSLPISIFMCLKRPLNWLKIKITKVGESLNGIAKQCLKLNVCKSVTRNILCDLLQGVSVIEMSVLGVNGSLDLKMMSAIERCRL